MKRSFYVELRREAESKKAPVQGVKPKHPYKTLVENSWGGAGERQVGAPPCLRKRAHRARTVYTLQTPNPTWTPKVCRIVDFYRCWAIILPTFVGLSTP